MGAGTEDSANSHRGARGYRPVRPGQQIFRVHVDQEQNPNKNGTVIVVLCRCRNLGLVCCWRSIVKAACETPVSLLSY